MADVNNFSSIKIGIASPETIRSWSHGEVTKSETINYRSTKPEKDGLFCERIFGPVKDFECACGKYKKTRAKGITCDKCGVDVVRSKVRRERMGHIELACPVTHIWFLKGAPYRISMLLDIPLKELELVVYYNKYVVLDKGQSDFEYKQIIDDREYLEAVDKFGSNAFEVGMGGAAIKRLLADVDLEKEYEDLNKTIAEAKDGSPIKTRAAKRLEVVQAFRTSDNKPQWMVLDVLPVLPPDLRPMVALDGGRYAASDLNDLYRRVIMRNNRLKKMLEIGSPDIIIRNEKRMLQEAVDALIDNGRRGKAVTTNNRKVKSLTELLKGKQGRFRQNLLGKRVDYSGRSVIVVGPELKMYQCGLPKEMAIELFKPFVIKELVEQEYASNVKSAKRIIDNPTSYVWDILEDVIKDHPVLLNRAPSLHRLSIQAFEPVLVDGRAIKLHPLVCTAFNADFDGDQMAVHVPLSLEARAEARFLMLSTNNILKLSDGKPVVSPSQDIVIGCYYLTMPEDPAKRTLDRRVFRNPDEALMAYQTKQISLQKEIEVRVSKVIDGKEYSKRITTSVGKLIFNSAIPQDLGLQKRDPADPLSYLDLEINSIVAKKDLSRIVDRVFAKKGATETAVVLDKIKALGYKYSTVGAITASIFDMHVPQEKQKFLDVAQKKVIDIERASRKGLTTESNRYQETIKAWTAAKTEVSNILEKQGKTSDFYNPIWMMANSGARGGIGQISQLCGMRGIVASTSGKDIELPIKSSYREGLSVLEYFISAHGGRKGMADTALKTADSGYLTRRLVDVCHHVVVYEQDCGDVKGTVVKNNDYITFSKSVLGCKAALDCLDKSTGKAVITKGRVITAEDVKNLYNAKVGRVQVMKDGKEEEIVLNDKAGKNFIDKIDGRFVINDVVDPFTGEVLVAAGQMITPDQAKAIDKSGMQEITIRAIISCKAKNGVCAKCYGKNMASGNIVKVGEAVGIIAAQSIGEPGTQLTMRTFHTGGVATSGDITNGLPRVQELFEVRRPKGQATISDIDGVVSVEENSSGVRIVTVTGVDKFTGKEDKREYPIDYNKKICVKTGEKIAAGDRITLGSIYPQDLLRTKGPAAVQEYIIDEVKKTYESSNAEINEKHLEIIVRQMLRRVRITAVGSTNLLLGDVVDERVLQEANQKVLAEGGEPALGARILQGITKSSLAVDSFLSAASFQETARVLADAAMKGKVDHLQGLKENVIIGKLIPAGTGTKIYENVITVNKASEMNVIKEENLDTKFAVENED